MVVLDGFRSFQVALRFSKYIYKEEIVLSRDSKELFVQRFVKVFDQN